MPSFYDFILYVFCNESKSLLSGEVKWRCKNNEHSKFDNVIHNSDHIIYALHYGNIFDMK